MPVAEIIAIAIQKGGVAKTTTALNLVAGLVLLGHSCLLVDLDPQANATEAMPLENYEQLRNHNVYHLLSEEQTLNDVTTVINEKIAVVPSNIRLASLEPSLSGATDAYRLKDALEGQPYDFVIIDCPPSLGPLTTNALLAADHVLLPLKPSTFGLSAVADFMDTFSLVKKRLNKDLNFLGIVLTLYDPRTNITKDVETIIKEDFGTLLFNTKIHVNVKLDEATGAKQSIFKFAPDSKGAKDYLELVKEVVKRVS